jgi:hypothetical protein
MAVISTLKVEIEGKEFQVTGGNFYDILTSVKAVPGRRWDGDRKLWILPLTIAEAKEALSEYKILGDEDEVIDAEIAEIEKLQKWILEDEEKVLTEAQSLDTKVKSYSFHSKSSVKASLATEAACLHHAINSAKMPIEKLAEIQIKGMKAACKYMGWI